MHDTSTQSLEELRTRVEAIAAETGLSTVDKSEPLPELIERARWAIEEEIAEITTQFEDLLEQLNDIEAEFDVLDLEGSEGTP